MIGSYTVKFTVSSDTLALAYADKMCASLKVVALINLRPRDVLAKHIMMTCQ
jgi:hypothetical protein